MSTSVSSIGKGGTNGQVPIGSSAGIPIYANITSMDGSVTITNGSHSIDLSASGGGFVAPLVTAYSTPGTFTWTKSANVVRMEIIAINGGCGGASGQRGVSGSTNGGGGGSNGGALYFSGSPIHFGATETVVVGAGGAGGAAQTVNNTTGTTGAVGGISKFGNITGPYNPLFGPPYTGGGNADGTGGSPSFGAAYTNYGTLIYGAAPSVDPNTLWETSEGGSSSAGSNGSVGTDTFASYLTGTGGGGGGPSNSAVLYSGGNGGSISDAFNLNVLIAGGAGGIESGTINGAAGTTGSYTSGGLIYGGTGGGGGGGQHTGGAAGTGGVGGAFGGGGGGGGASINGTNSGAGGNGGAGLVVVIEYYS